MEDKNISHEPLKIVVIDVLKPHKPNIVDFCRAISAEKSIEGVNISVYAIDEKTESLKIAIEGEDIDFDSFRKVVEDYGGAVHSVDQVIAGKKEIIPVPQLEKTE